MLTKRPSFFLEEKSGIDSTKRLKVEPNIESFCLIVPDPDLANEAKESNPLTIDKIRLLMQSVDCDPAAYQLLAQFQDTPSWSLDDLLILFNLLKKHNLFTSDNMNMLFMFDNSPLEPIGFLDRFHLLNQQNLTMILERNIHFIMDYEIALDFLFGLYNPRAQNNWEQLIQYKSILLSDESSKDFWRLFIRVCKKPLYLQAAFDDIISVAARYTENPVQGKKAVWTVIKTDAIKRNKPLMKFLGKDFSRVQQCSGYIGDILEYYFIDGTLNRSKLNAILNAPHLWASAVNILYRFNLASPKNIRSVIKNDIVIQFLSEKEDESSLLTQELLAGVVQIAEQDKGDALEIGTPILERFWEFVTECDNELLKKHGIALIIKYPENGFWAVEFFLKFGYLQTGSNIKNLVAYAAIFCADNARLIWEKMEFCGALQSSFDTVTAIAKAYWDFPDLGQKEVLLWLQNCSNDISFKYCIDLLVGLGVHFDKNKSDYIKEKIEVFYPIVNLFESEDLCTRENMDILIALGNILFNPKFWSMPPVCLSQKLFDEMVVRADRYKESPAQAEESILNLLQYMLPRVQFVFHTIEQFDIEVSSQNRELINSNIANYVVFMTRLNQAHLLSAHDCKAQANLISFMEHQEILGNKEIWKDISNDWLTQDVLEQIILIIREEKNKCSVLSDSDLSRLSQEIRNLLIKKGKILSYVNMLKHAGLDLSSKALLQIERHHKQCQMTLPFLKQTGLIEKENIEFLWRYDVLWTASIWNECHLFTINQAIFTEMVRRAEVGHQKPDAGLKDIISYLNKTFRLQQVENSVSSMVRTLKVRYQHSISAKPQREIFYQEIVAFILEQAPAAKNAIERIINSKQAYPLDPSSWVSLKELLLLIWVAIHDDECRTSSLVDAKRLLVISFVEGMELCTSGMFNSLVHGLVQTHPHRIVAVSEDEVLEGTKLIIQKQAWDYLETAKVESPEQYEVLIEHIQDKGLFIIEPSIYQSVENNLYEQFGAYKSNFYQKISTCMHALKKCSSSYPAGELVRAMDDVLGSNGRAVSLKTLIEALPRKYINQNGDEVILFLTELTQTLGHYLNRELNANEGPLFFYHSMSKKYKYFDDMIKHVLLSIEGAEFLEETRRSLSP